MAEIQSLARGLRILESLALADAVSVTQLAEQLNVDKASASRQVQTLAQYGYAEEDPDTQRYRLGPQVVKLGQSLLGRMPLRDEGKPFLRDLVARTGECAHIVDPELLEMHLEQVRRQGYATDDEEYEYGVRCIAAPVYDLNGDMVGAIGISGPSNRMTLDRIPELAACRREQVQGLNGPYLASFSVQSGRF